MAPLNCEIRSGIVHMLSAWAVSPKQASSDLQLLLPLPPKPGEHKARRMLHRLCTSRNEGQVKAELATFQKNLNSFTIHE
jgi:hypothetical protein